jgi:hypothetical protein
MKCFYILANDLDHADKVIGDFRKLGVSDDFLHVLGKDEAGIAEHHLNSSNYLESLDFFREGLIGALLGLFAGGLFSATLNYLDPFHIPMSTLASAGVVLLFTCFGAWSGAMIGLSQENIKIRDYHDAIDEGQLLIIAYLFKSEEEQILPELMRAHPELKIAGEDSHFLNPFAVPQKI